MVRLCVSSRQIGISIKKGPIGSKNKNAIRSSHSGLKAPTDETKNNAGEQIIFLSKYGMTPYKPNKVSKQHEGCRKM